MKPKTIKIAIVDDIPLFRDGLKLLLSEFKEIEIQFEAENGKDFLEKLQHQTPHVILLDLEMPEMDGFDVTAHLNKNYPDIKIIILTFINSESVIRYLLQAGAHGFLLKTSKVKEIADAVHSVIDIGYYFNDKISIPMVIDLFKTRMVKPIFGKEAITEREIDILNLYYQQLDRNEIADKLCIEPTTVDFHRINIIRKTKSKNIIGAVLYGLKHDLFK